MIIKKYKAKTEKDAMLMAQEELGKDAIVMNVKTIKPGGIMKLFKKPEVELTAAIDDAIEKDKPQEKIDKKESYRFGEVFAGNKSEYSDDAKNAIEEKINTLAKLIEQQMGPNTSSSDAEKAEIKDEKDEAEKYVQEKNDESSTRTTSSASRSKVVNLIHDQLIDNEVTEENVDVIIGELDSENQKLPIDNILANAYQKIVLKLGKVEPIKPCEDEPKLIFFVGNTGVGKTTTMAKLASKLKLVEKYKIALISVDTYRIAAIEQLKTYADILNVPLKVVYTPDDMKKTVEEFKDYDFILVDTAGRSHRNDEQKKDLSAIIESVDEYKKEVYLVVSVTVKYNDLLSIAKTYDEIVDYKIIFTKLDETRGLGNMLNLKLDTGKTLSYVTWGQNVPDDIGVLDPQIIAKKLLGGAK